MFFTGPFCFYLIISRHADVHGGDREFWLHHVRPEVRLERRGHLGPDVAGGHAASVQGARTQTEADRGQPDLGQLLQTAS